MKTLKFIITFCSFSFFILNISCKKDSHYMNDGILTGFDARLCGCCGGLMITFSDNVVPYNTEFKLIDNWAGFGIKENDKFPVYVQVDWKPATNSICNHIIITRLKRK